MLCSRRSVGSSDVAVVVADASAGRLTAIPVAHKGRHSSMDDASAT